MYFTIYFRRRYLLYCCKESKVAERRTSVRKSDQDGSDSEENLVIARPAGERGEAVTDSLQARQSSLRDEFARSVSEDCLGVVIDEAGQATLMYRSATPRQATSR